MRRQSMEGDSSAYLEVLEDSTSHSPKKDGNALDIMNGTSTASPITTTTSRPATSRPISQSYAQKRYLTAILSSGEARAKIYLWLESEKDSLVQGVDYFLSSCASLRKSNLHILSGRMLNALSALMAEEIMLQSSLRFPKQATMFNGSFATPKTSGYPSTGSASLSSVLESDVPEKYFLSEAMTKRLLTKSAAIRNSKMLKP